MVMGLSAVGFKGLTFRVESSSRVLEGFAQEILYGSLPGVI